MNPTGTMCRGTAGFFSFCRGTFKIVHPESHPLPYTFANRQVVWIDTKDLQDYVSKHRATL
jgi:hypothetical protein